MNGDLYDRYVTDLKLRGYAKRSRQSYRRSLRQFQNFTNKSFEDITEEDLREYWLACKEELGWSPATPRISYSAIKHFYTHVLKRDWEVLRTVRFERQQTLPTVLSIDGVRAIIAEMSHTPQNHAYYSVVYSCGLRLSEAINLQVGDIDGKRRFVHVRHGKTVTFKHQKVGSSRWRRTTLNVLEFMRRFLQHTLPSGFMKIRHYGFMSPNFSVPIQKICETICVLYELLRGRPVKADPPRKPKPLRCERRNALMRWVCFIPPRPLHLIS